MKYTAASVRRSLSLLILLACSFGCSASYPTVPDPLPVVSVRVTTSLPSTSTVPLGRTVSIGLTAIDSDRVYHFVSATEVTWFSSDSSILRPYLISNSNTFLAVGTGTASLYGSYKGYTDHIDITVSAAQ